MTEITEGAGIGDSIEVELVKGPDPEEWGEEQTIAPVVPVPSIEDLPEGVKGPDPAKWGHEQAGLPAPEER